MSLWNLIRDWFVQYIWGGYDSLGNSYGNFSVGHFLVHYHTLDDSYVDEFDMSTNYVNIDLNGIHAGDGTLDAIYSITMGDWLSTTSTIIVLVLLLIAFGYLIVNLFKMFSNIFSLKR